MPYRLPSNKGEYVVEEVLQAEQSTTVSRVRYATSIQLYIHK